MSTCCQRFYNYLELKSKHPDAAVPPLDKTLKRITEPDPELLAKKKSAIDSLLRHFEVKEKPKVSFIKSPRKQKFPISPYIYFGDIFPGL